MKQLYIFCTLALFFLCQHANSQTWWPQNSKTFSDLNEIFYPTDNTGWAFGDSLDILNGFATGVVLKSMHQGVPWFQQSMGTPVYQIEGSYFFNSAKGVAVGRNKLSGNGAIIITTDAGGLWTAAPPQPERLVDVHFANNNVGWTVGRNDFVLRTTDGGNTWTDISAATGDHLNGVYFTSPINGYVVGKAGNIIHSVDSGNTWLAQASGTTEDLNAVYFVDDSTGWTVGKAGTILLTNDSGMTWSPQTSGTSEDLMDVAFVNDTVGWTVGTAGIVLKTTDAGLNWVNDSSGTTEDIMSITMRSATLGWFCGKNGIIYVYGVNPPNGVHELLSPQNLAAYPNPASDHFTVGLPIIGNWDAYLYDLTGSLVYVQHTLNTSKIEITKQEGWNRGLYFIKIISENGKALHGKVVIE